MDPRLFLSQSRHLLAALAFGYLVLAGYRWIRRRSEVIGAIVAMTIVGRAAVGLALFWTSYLYLPIAPALFIALTHHFANRTGFPSTFTRNRLYGFSLRSFPSW